MYAPASRESRTRIGEEGLKPLPTSQMPSENSHCAIRIATSAVEGACGLGVRTLRSRS